jgi:NAD(P)-dependent dehydrogenase (short-subunit alcohol dehydrogenase family)
VCEACLPLLDPSSGRIVNVTSASGPSFVARCSEERRRFFTDPRTDWPALVALMDECLGLGEDAEAFAARGLGDGDAYGLSKACANTYTQHLALEHPRLRINACTPGFIETDMTRPYAEARGESPTAMGMKPPAEGARCPLFLLFGEPEGNGRFYGSDAKRSPLDRYRSPGSPAYTGA